MQRVATYMAVKHGVEAHHREEYANIWPGVLVGITRLDIHNYSSFMHGRKLYSYFEVENLDPTMAMAATDQDNQHWQVHIADFFGVGLGVQDGSTSFLVKVFCASGNTNLQPPLKSVGWLDRSNPVCQDDLKSTCPSAPKVIFGLNQREGIRTDCIYLIGQMLFTNFQAQGLAQAWHKSVSGLLGAALFRETRGGVLCPLKLSLLQRSNPISTASSRHCTTASQIGCPWRKPR